MGRACANTLHHVHMLRERPFMNGSKRLCVGFHFLCYVDLTANLLKVQIVGVCENAAWPDIFQLMRRMGSVSCSLEGFLGPWTKCDLAAEVWLRAKVWMACDSSRRDPEGTQQLKKQLGELVMCHRLKPTRMQMYSPHRPTLRAFEALCNPARVRLAQHSWEASGIRGIRGPSHRHLTRAFPGYPAFQ